jgi:hypothetical protein
MAPTVDIAVEDTSFQCHKECVKCVCSISALLDKFYQAFPPPPPPLSPFFLPQERKALGHGLAVALACYRVAEWSCYRGADIVTVVVVLLQGW